MEERLKELLEVADVKDWTDEKIENFNFDDTDEREALSQSFKCLSNCPVKKTCSKITYITQGRANCQDILMMFCAGIIELDKRE